MRDIEFFTFVSREYFEPLSRYPIASHYQDLVKDLIPTDWKLDRFEIWLMARPAEYRTIEQGFKIHVSATVLTAEEILRRIVPEYVRSGVAFKLVADRNLLWLMNSKNYGRGSSGKFLVAYPQTFTEFTSLIERVHVLTEALEGPYILSDRRYKESKVVYYRYGSFQQLEVLALDGRKTSCIRDPTGELVPDERLPYFNLPPWVEDPFPTEQEETEESVLNGRYRIDSALSFTNSGGVYKGIDLTTSTDVVVKEARPWTCLWAPDEGDGYVDAPKICEKEFRILRKLEGLSCVPRAIDFFQEWEHFFLVEEFVEGMPLTRYRATEDFILLPYADRQTRVRGFCREFRHLAQNLIKALRELHGRGILMGDLSPNNVLVNRETKALTLVDFECAIDLEVPDLADTFVSRMHTPGFRREDRLITPLIGPEDDYYAAGMVLYSLLMPIQTLFALKPAAQEEFLEEIERYVGLPSEVGGTIRALLNNKVEEASQILKCWDLGNVRRRGRAQSRPRPCLEQWRAQLDPRINDALSGIKSHLLATIDSERRDRVWPADIEVFRTNPLNVACGAGGPLLLLKDLGCSIPEPVETWLREQQPVKERYPPGLFAGLAGIAQVFAELGYDDMAAAALEESYRSPLVFAAADYLHGAAGWGMVQLWFFERKRQAIHLERACEAGEQILAMAEQRERNLCWRNPLDREVHFGLGYGASGVALFLLNLYRATRHKSFRTAAEAAIRFELSNAHKPRSSALKWPNYEGAVDIFEPYWRHGSAGIASTLIRFYTLLGDSRYCVLAERAANFAYTKFAVQPTQFEGLSGIGEMALDLFLATGKECFLQMAYELAGAILLYAVPTSRGIAFPGRLLVRLSNDYGTGSAGVGLFFHRLLNLGPRRFHDIAAVTRPAKTCEPVTAQIEDAVSLS